ncbi:MAG TPA: branched-chain amino acid ABC transporter permease [Burkholderiaceae bacterium]|nr:branched-chain amino acid ABC transporter permease [Burkholderiaceae bacterium]
MRQRMMLAGSAIAFVAAPFLVDQYWLYWVCLIAINIISATGLNILSGYTGLASLGQAAFMGVGAYTVALLELHVGSSFLINVPIAGAVTALIGLVVGIPSLRVKGLYLAIATIAASVILEFTFANWETVTNGVKGMTVAPAQIFGIDLDRPARLYWVIVPTTIVLLVMASNLFRTRVGRAFIAIRDRDISAEVLGIPLLKYKLLSFGLSSFYAGVAGGLWAYFFRVVTPESFPIVMSIFFLAAIIVGGLGTIRGSILGAAFMTVVPELLRVGFTFLTPWIPDAMSIIPAVRSIVFGALIVGFLLFEPQGLAEVLPRLRRFFGRRSPRS